MDNIPEKKTVTEGGIQWPSTTQIYEREACTKYVKCPYCPAAYRLSTGFPLRKHLQLHLEGSLRQHRMYDFLMKESDTLRWRCRYQCKNNLFSTTTYTHGWIYKENGFWNQLHYAREHYYGEDQMVPIEERIECNRCPFRCSKSYDYSRGRDLHERRSHKEDNIMFADEHSSQSSQSQRCKEQCLYQQGHVGHPKTDLDIFQWNDWNQCRKQCLGYPAPSGSDSASV